jgi:hypothetical protein
MVHLPKNKNLPVHLLAACFNNTTATYKFYWLLSIIQSVESGKTLISKRELFSRMISNAWYTVNYFHLSFGVSDILHRAVQGLMQHENITVDSSPEYIQEKMMASTKKETTRMLLEFDRYVPDRFLSPWFPGQDKSSVYIDSNDITNNSPYGLNKEFINVNLLWANYFLENAAVLKDFCYWNLALFLQGKNPNVPDIPNKLIKPAKRNSLTGQRKRFWDVILEERTDLKCIYTNKLLELGKYAVEHFIPYSFVSHDLVWNLIPADSSFNSSKSDKLPPLDRYFNSFFNLQKSAVTILKEKQPRNPFLEDYLTIFPNLYKAFTRDNFKERIEPLITIAANNGFEFMK